MDPGRFFLPLRRLLTTLFAGCLLIAGAAAAGEVRVAAAANFTEAARAIGAQFTRSTGHTVRYSFGSTGQLFTQIAQGAPFDVFLAADQERPKRAVTEGYAVAGSRFTYATGKLVLFSKDDARVSDARSLTGSDFRRLAIANPVTAPYGSAAVAVLNALGVYEAVAARIVRGNNIAQTYQFVETGNAELGFVSLSQIVRHRAGSRWLVPQALYPPIAQDAVLLVQGRENSAARQFLAFLGGPEAAAIKREFGYGVD